MSPLAWLQASRPLAQGLVVPPLLFGQALAWARHGTFDWTMFAWVHGFGVLDQLFILWVNDLTDVETDRLNRTPTRFSGGSRVLVDGKLDARSLRNGALVVLALIIACAATLAVRYVRPLVPSLVAAGVLLVWAYSLPPLRLAYRGGGEWLQALGVGVVLPLFAYYLQAGALEAFPWPVLGGALLVALGGNVTTSLPDHDSDRESHKHTWTVRRGPRAARVDSLVVLALGVTGLVLACPDVPTLHRTLVIAIACAPLALNAARLGNPASADARGAETFVLTNGVSMTLAWLLPAALLAWG